MKTMTKTNTLDPVWNSKDTHDKNRHTFHKVNLNDGELNKLKIEVWDDKDGMWSKRQQIGSAEVDIKEVFGVHYKDEHAFTRVLQLEYDKNHCSGTRGIKPELTISGKYTPKNVELPQASMKHAEVPKGSNYSKK